LSADLYGAGDDTRRQTEMSVTAVDEKMQEVNYAHNDFPAVSLNNAHFVYG